MVCYNLLMIIFHILNLLYCDALVRNYIINDANNMLFYLFIDKNLGISIFETEQPTKSKSLAKRKALSGIFYHE